MVEIRGRYCDYPGNPVSIHTNRGHCLFLAKVQEFGATLRGVFLGYPASKRILQLAIGRIINGLT